MLHFFLNYINNIMSKENSEEEKRQPQPDRRKLGWVPSVRATRMLLTEQEAVFFLPDDMEVFQKCCQQVTVSINSCSTQGQGLRDGSLCLAQLTGLVVTVKITKCPVLGSPRQDRPSWGRVSPPQDLFSRLFQEPRLPGLGRGKTEGDSSQLCLQSLSRAPLSARPPPPCVQAATADPHNGPPLSLVPALLFSALGQSCFQKEATATY